MSSDQNITGLPNGNVTRARALARLVPSKKLQPSRLERMSATPWLEQPNAKDVIEEDRRPHTRDVPEKIKDMSEPNIEHAKRRVQITLDNLQRHGFT